MANLHLHHFNAIEYLQELRQADFTEKQAEAVVKMAEQQAQIIQEQKHEIDNLKSRELATKADLNNSLKDLELKLQAQIEQTRAEIHKSKYEVIIWIGGLLIASGVIQHFFK